MVLLITPSVELSVFFIVLKEKKRKAEIRKTENKKVSGVPTEYNSIVHKTVYVVGILCRKQNQKERKKKTVEIAQLWQHNQGNCTTLTIFQKKK